MSQSDYSGQRWFAAKNECEYEIPGFAMIQFHDRVIDGVRNRFINNFAEETDIIFEVERPTSEVVSRGDPTAFCFNGPVPIPPKRYKGRGLVTQNFPAQVLHDGSRDSLPNGRRCGPQADSFFCWSTGNGFTCISHDGTQAVNKSDGVHTVWLGRSLGLSGGHARGTFEGSYEPDTVIPISFSRPPAALGVEQGTGPDPFYGFLVREDGMYQFGWQASASSPDAERGWPLQVRAYVQRAPTESSPSPSPEATIWQVMRYQVIESDTEYGNDFLTGLENMAMSGWENLRTGDELFFKNLTSEKTLMLAVGSAWIMKSKPYFDETTPGHGGLTYP